MIVNDEGHIEMADGSTTGVAPGECPMYYVGNSLVHISFTYQLLPDGGVVLHSQLREPDYEEDFLYEVHPRGEAYAEALTMVQDACEYLESLDCHLDGNASTHVFLMALSQALRNRLH